MKPIMLEWKTIKFFLSIDGVDEVQASTEKDLRCTCVGFTTRNKCKHVQHVSGSLKDGVFPVEIAKHAPKEAVLLAKESHEAFRELLLRYGKVTVL